MRAARPPAIGMATIEPDGGAGEHDAELAVGEPDAVAHGGDARRPGTEDEAVEEEDRGDGGARLLGRSAHARTHLDAEVAVDAQLVVGGVADERVDALDAGHGVRAGGAELARGR